MCMKYDDTISLVENYIILLRRDGLTQNKIINQNFYIVKYSTMTKRPEDDWNLMTLTETIKKLKALSKENKLSWDNQEETYTEIEWELGRKGRRLLCHIAKEAPYKIRYRLVWEPKYETVMPEKFITKALSKLQH